MKKGTMYTFVFTIFIATVLQFCLARVCNTPDGKVGDCINLRDCQPVINLLRRRPLTSSSFTYIRQSHCGFDDQIPLVCCERIQALRMGPEETTTPKIIEEPPEQYPSPPNVSNHPNLHMINPLNCGTITQKKIIRGDKTGIFEFPWMALIAYNTRDSTQFRCGGTVINKRYILTAAHCITQFKEPITLAGVRVGDHDVTTERDCEPKGESGEEDCAERFQDFEIESIHYHPNFTKTKFANDIGLIRLKTEIDFRPRNSRPICLPTNGVIPSRRKKVIVTGWGQTEKAAASKKLLMVQLPVISNKRCSRIYNNTVDIGHMQMCAGGRDRKDSCIGDSGGPLQMPGNVTGTIKFIQHGIVSFGLDTCGVEGYPGVYTRVVYYLDWILNTIRE